MIHLFIWLGHAAGWSFATFVLVVALVVLASLGPVGVAIGVGASALSLLIWVAPDVAGVVAGYFAVALLLLGVAIAVIRLLAPLVVRDRSSYRRAVFAGDEARAAWWRPTLGERLSIGGGRHLAPLPDDPTAHVDHAAVAELHAWYAANRAETGDPLRSLPAPVAPVVAPPNGARP